MSSKYKQPAEEIMLKKSIDRLNRYQYVADGISLLLRREVIDMKTGAVVSQIEENLVDLDTNLEDLEAKHKVFSRCIEKMGSLHVIRLIGPEELAVEIKQTEEDIDRLANAPRLA